jgi:hypothetical protein
MLVGSWTVVRSTEMVVVTMKKTISRKAMSAIDAVGMYDSAVFGGFSFIASSHCLLSKWK